MFIVAEARCFEQSLPGSGDGFRHRDRQTMKSAKAKNTAKST